MPENGLNNNGKVYLVGAGPGDPELLTVKALRLIKQCDVIIYDALLNHDILDEIPEYAERIFIGKPREKFRISQKKVEELMVERARAGKMVVRLKGGDPFIFGRGGEEAEVLSKFGVDWEVVPGISAGIAAPAYAGIPLTHRDFASTVAFVTGQEKEGKKSPINWEHLAHAVDTIVVFMTVKNLPVVVENLVKAGRPESVPVAVIECGTYENQKVVTGTLGDILPKINSAKIQPPALTVIGEVVRFEKKLAWFQKNLLDNKLARESRLNIENEILSPLS